jgi:hypothetical protein
MQVLGLCKIIYEFIRTQTTNGRLSPKGWMLGLFDLGLHFLLKLKTKWKPLVVVKKSGGVPLAYKWIPSGVHTLAICVGCKIPASLRTRTLTALATGYLKILIILDVHHYKTGVLHCLNYSLIRTVFRDLDEVGWSLLWHSRYALKRPGILASVQIK